jgi:hypothetical protein
MRRYPSLQLETRIDAAEDHYKVVGQERRHLWRKEGTALGHRGQCHRSELAW